MLSTVQHQTQRHSTHPEKRWCVELRVRATGTVIVGLRAH